MNHWTIGNPEVRQAVQAQEDRYRELRRHSAEAQLLREALGPRPTLIGRLIRGLEALLKRMRRMTGNPAAGAGQVVKR
jgi:hypothetical protein